MTLGKLFIRSFLVCALVSLTGVSVLAEVMGTVNGSNVNVREAESTSATVLDKLNSGNEINILGKNGEWYKVSYDSIGTAYVSSQFIDVTKADAIVSDKDVNIRIAPNTTADVYSIATLGENVVVIGKTDNWYQLDMNDGMAYINKNYLSGYLIEEAKTINAPKAETVAEDTYGIVTAQSGLKLRADMAIGSDVEIVLPYNEIVDVIEPNGEWTKVKTSFGVTGYVSTEFLNIRSGEKPSRGNTSKGDQIVAYAKQYLGTNYVWGGTNLNAGVDCSGFVYSVYEHFGIELNRSSASMASNGVPVDKSQLVAGDLVLFDTTGANDGNISHVGIYMGNGEYMHSSSGKAYGVTISDLNNAYGLSTYVTARRVLR